MKEEEPLTAKQTQQKKQAEGAPEFVPTKLGKGGSELAGSNAEPAEPEKLETLVKVDESIDSDKLSDEKPHPGSQDETLVNEKDAKKTNENSTRAIEPAGEDRNEQGEQPEVSVEIEKTSKEIYPQDDLKVKDESESEQKEETLSRPKKIKPKWQDNEPPDELQDRVEHVMKVSSVYGKWGIVAASLRGKSHAHKGSFREDSYKYDKEGPWTIIAVGDGAGSAKLSRVGSRAACDAAVEKIKQLLKGYVLGTEKNAERPSETELSQLKAFLVLAASEAKNALVNKCHEKKCQFDDLSTTLLLVIHCEWNSQHVLGSLQVGDGAIGIFEDEKHTCTLFGDADHGAHASETIFLTSTGKLNEKPFDQRIQFTIKPVLKCVAVMTDGVSDDFFPEKDRLIELFNGDPISVKGLVTANEEPKKGVIHDVLNDPDGGDSLVDWLSYEKRGSFDDRTLVLFYRK